MRVVMAEGTCLRDGALRAGDDVLLFQGLNPKTRREIGEISDEGDEGAAGIDRIPAFAKLAIKVRDHGNEQVGRSLLPEILEQTEHRAMEDADGGLQKAQQVGTAQGPAVAEQDVVLLLDADTSEFAKNVELVGKLLKMN